MDTIPKERGPNRFRIFTNLYVGSFLLFTISAFGQAFGEKELKGRVVSSDGDVAATHVLNTTTKRAAITDVNGYFSIGVHLNDTLVFSAVQFRKKTIVVTMGVLDSKFITVTLEDANIALDEVVVTPYNLTGELARDMRRLNVPTPKTASSLGLPNADVRVITQAERHLFTATSNPFMGLDPLINALSGRTKMLKRRVELENKYSKTQRVKQFYPDSVLVRELKIPELKLDDFLYFCEMDGTFAEVIATRDKLKIWEYLRDRSVVYRRNNGLQ